MRSLVAIPVFNEAATLQGVLRQIREYASDIVVIDDGSTDATPQLLDQETGIFKIRHHTNLGYGQSLIDAFRFAICRGYDWLVTIDCDEQHEPERIPEFLQVAAEGDVDIVSGSRYLSEFEDNSLPPMDRRAINQKVTDLLNEILELNLTDSFCGFKAYRVSALKRLRITVPGYAMPLQFWVQAAREGLRVRELPVRLIYNNPNRYFGGSLDDADQRLLYYYDVLIHELAKPITRLQRERGYSERNYERCEDAG